MLSEKSYGDISENVSDSSPVLGSLFKGGVGVHCAAAVARRRATVGTSGRREQFSLQQSSTVVHTRSVKPIA